MQQIEVAKTPDYSLLNMLDSADLASKLVIGFLVLMSIVSWAIIFDKYFKYRYIQKKILAFEAAFWGTPNLEQLYDKARKVIETNPMAAIFSSAMVEFKKNRLTTDKVMTGQRLMHTMQVAKNKEVDKCEYGVSVLGIIGSYAVLVGLLGTVLGMMHSFQQIMISKNSSLAAVAPGMSEALFATAVGIVVAIPAAVFYNIFSNKVGAIENSLDYFILEVYNTLTNEMESK